METSAHQQINELLGAYALGCLESEEATLVAEHLASCSACRAELQALQGVAFQLALAAPDATPPAHLKDRLMEQVQPARPTIISRPRVSWQERLASVWQRSAPAWGLVSLVLILALTLGNLTLRQQLNASKADTGAMRIVTLDSTDAAPGASGVLVMSVDGEHGTLVVDGLVPLDEMQQYQLWLIKNGQRTSGGVFSVSDEGYGALWISSPAPLSSYPAFGITIEPTGGSPGPTGDKVLGGSL